MGKRNAAPEDEMTEETQVEEVFSEAPRRVTRTIEVEIAEEFAEKPVVWDHDTLADRLDEARALLKTYDFVSEVEDRKVRKRITKALFGYSPEA